MRSSAPRTFGARAVGVHDSGNRLCRNPRLPRIRDDATAVERIDDGIVQRQPSRRDIPAEPQPESAAHCGGVVILATTSDAQILDLEAPAFFGEVGRLGMFAAPGGQRTQHGHTSGGRATQSRAQRILGLHADAYARHGRAPRRGNGEGVVRALHGGRGSVVAGQRPNRRYGVELDRHVAHAPAPFIAVWGDIRPASSEVETSRRAGNEERHGYKGIGGRGELHWGS